ncbi:MAG TPA: cytochrome c [Cyclobacteriaceae bacterium]|nr:cytochrome c [Cyclobacteriaceae bacterium]
MIPLKTLKTLLGVATLLSFILSGFTLFSYQAGPEKSSANAGNYPDWPPIKEYPDVAGTAVFKANCKSCHRLDEVLIGPALRHVYSRRDSVWLRNWISNSSKMITAGDPAAVQLFNDYKQAQMTNFSTMKKEEMDSLLVFLRLVDKVN